MRGAAERLGVIFIERAITGAHQLIEMHPNAAAIIGADGRHSVLRETLFAQSQDSLTAAQRATVSGEVVVKAVYLPQEGAPEPAAAAGGARGRASATALSFDVHRRADEEAASSATSAVAGAELKQEHVQTRVLQHTIYINFKLEGADALKAHNLEGGRAQLLSACPCPLHSLSVRRCPMIFGVCCVVVESRSQRCATLCCEQERCRTSCSTPRTASCMSRTTPSASSWAASSRTGLPHSPLAVLTCPHTNDDCSSRHHANTCLHHARGPDRAASAARSVSLTAIFFIEASTAASMSSCRKNSARGPGSLAGDDRVPTELSSDVRRYLTQRFGAGAVDLEALQLIYVAIDRYCSDGIAQTHSSTGVFLVGDACFGVPYFRVSSAILVAVPVRCSAHARLLFDCVLPGAHQRAQVRKYPRAVPRDARFGPHPRYATGTDTASFSFF